MVVAKVLAVMVLISILVIMYFTAEAAILFFSQHQLDFEGRLLVVVMPAVMLGIITLFIVERKLFLGMLYSSESLCRSGAQQLMKGDEQLATVTGS